MKYVEYVARRKEEGCIFCEAARARDPEEKLVVYKTDRSIAVMNLYPYNTGHLMVAPLRHVPSIEDLGEEELLDLFSLVRRCLRLLRRAFKPDGFNVGINIGRVAGAGVEGHVHVHIVPRWCGDTNFMPVIASTKVIPEGIRDTYRRLMRERGAVT